MKKMNKFLVLMALTSINTFAANTGSITISGTIPVTTAITVTAEGDADNLNLSQNATNKKVATVREMSNSLRGYSVHLSSANAGKLKNGSLGEITYTAKYAGSNVTLSTSPVRVTNQGNQSSVIGVNKDFNISYTGISAESLMEGSYSDTLTFTISAN